MAERTVELEQPTLTDESANALREATDRAERAEAELAKVKSQQMHASAKPAGSADVTTQGVPERGAKSHNDTVSTDDLKQPPSPNTAANAPQGSAGPAAGERGSADEGGVEELRKDPMMTTLLDALDAGQDVGHYGRLTFSMVARHFLPHDEVLAWLTKDQDFGEEQARLMLHQVEGRDYSPPRRERLLEWQSEQEFQFLDPHDPDSGNLYRNLKFPQAIYEHIGHYQEAKSESA